MAIATYAVLDTEKKVFDIVDMDILDEIPAPYPNAEYVKVIDTIPTIGQVWDGEKFN